MYLSKLLSSSSLGSKKLGVVTATTFADEALKAVVTSPAHHGLRRVSPVRYVTKFATSLFTMLKSSSKSFKSSESMKTRSFLSACCNKIFSNLACAAAAALWWQMNHENFGLRFISTTHIANARDPATIKISELITRMLITLSTSSDVSTPDCVAREPETNKSTINTEQMLSTPFAITDRQGFVDDCNKENNKRKAHIIMI
mmetsp:Transcript_11252/g.39903  ORF Transcript_11252/g.39903 Transcript_11252/m.39903 type:complete len:201 (-) Transcript_11252:151-753(-)